MTCQSKEPAPCTRPSPAKVEPTLGGIGDLGGGIGARCFRFDGVDGAGRAARGGAIGSVVVADGSAGGNDQGDRGDRAEKSELTAQGEGGSRGITIDT